MANELVVIKINSKHEGFEVKRWIYNLFSISQWLVNIIIVIWISSKLYNECLFNPKANPIVVIYFCLISFGCLLNIGVSMDKLANISLTGK